MRRTLIFSIFAACMITSSCIIPQTPIRIGVNSWPPCEIWYVARDRGFFGGVPVEIIRFPSWSDNLKALYQGKIDVTHSTYFNSVYYSDKGEEAKIILSADYTLGLDGLVVKKPISKGEELKGKKIAVEVNTDEHFLLLKALQKFGLEEKDVTIIPANSEEAAGLFISNQADACFTYEPYLSSAAAGGGGRVIFTTADIPGWMVDTLTARTDVIKHRGDELARILSAWYRAQDFVRANPVVSFRIMAVQEGLSERDFRDFYGQFHFFTMTSNIALFQSRDMGAILAEMIDMLNKKNYIRKGTAAGGILEPGIVLKTDGASR